jgi:hypothetical protein
MVISIWPQARNRNYLVHTQMGRTDRGRTEDDDGDDGTDTTGRTDDIYIYIHIYIYIYIHIIIYYIKEERIIWKHVEKKKKYIYLEKI